MPVGWDAKLYRGAAGSEPATEMTNTRDIKLPFGVSEADISTRANRIELTDVAMLQAGVDFDMLWDESDADFAAIWTAFSTGASIGIKALGKATGSGFKSDCKVTKCEAALDLKGARIANVTIKPTKGTLAAQMVTGS